MTEPVRTRGGYPISDEDLAGLACLGGILYEARRRRGWTQWQVAHAVGVHQTTISRLEHGGLTNFSLVKLGRLVIALDLSSLGRR
jgi:transcriptional regulator with XRE-family HTH domain